MSNINPPAVVLASNNLGKLQEFREILGGMHIAIIPQSDLGVPEIEETGLTFVENSLLKARNAAKHTGLPALADDSGLEVAILNGAPGVISGRYAGPQVDFTLNCKKLLSDLIAAAEHERGAHFQCVLTLLRHERDPSPLICQGTWEGSILTQPKGSNGFGYDPLFFVPSHNCSAAELPTAIKNQISHRAQAITQLIQGLRAKLLNHSG